MQKKVHLEIIRIVAACLVVFNHTDGYFLYFSQTDNIVTYLVSLLASIVCKINVPLFFMVTGALLLEKREDIKTLFKKRVARIIIVIIAFSGVQYIALGIKNGSTQSLGVLDFIRRIYTGDVIEPYWFLYSYLTVLLVLPFLRRMVENMKAEEYRYLLMLQVILGMGCRLIAVYTGCAVNLSLFVLADNIFYVLLGYYMENVMPGEAYDSRNTRKAVLLAFCTVIISGGVIIGEYMVKGTYTVNLIGVFNPVLTLTCYFLIKSACSRVELSERCYQIFIYLGSAVFGIYLIEQLVRRQLLPMYLYLCKHTVGLLACLVYVTTTIILSVIYVSILKKIPGVRKLL